MKPTKAINQWSCALASIQATLNKYGNPITQEGMIKAYRQFFAAWQHNQEGLMTRVEIPYLLELLGYHFRVILFTQEKDEFLGSFTKYVNLNRYWGSFVIFHHPTNHCNAIHGVTGQGIEAMNPDQNNPTIQMKLFQDIHQNNDPEYILLCA